MNIRISYVIIMLFGKDGSIFSKYISKLNISKSLMIEIVETSHRRKSEKRQ